MNITQVMPRCVFIPRTVLSIALKLLQLVILKLAKWNVDPNYITIIGLITNLLASYFAYVQQFLISGLLLAFGGLCDYIDGGVARATLRNSSRGAALDSIADRLSEMVFLTALGFFFEQYGSRILAILSFVALIGSILTSYARAISRAESMGVFSCLFYRQDRVIILVVGLLLTSVNSLLFNSNSQSQGDIGQLFAIAYWPLSISVIVLAIFTCISAGQRILSIWKSDS
ncbi:MAG: hypothetical protein A2611_04295 [Candidatus Komeilibacteria bacterium RIFOXYD1_FULL_37_29]|nr:MAG: hypothetical protein A2611_04295 [Candidatus Komeilibacteria bacterium RIFOXYD1_FULL_37_29]